MIICFRAKREWEKKEGERQRKGREEKELNHWECSSLAARIKSSQSSRSRSLSPFGTQLLSREAAPNLSWSPDAADSGASGRLFPLVSFLSPPLPFSLFPSIHPQPVAPSFSSPLPPSPPTCSFLPPLLFYLPPSPTTRSFFLFPQESLFQTGSHTTLQNQLETILFCVPLKWIQRDFSGPAFYPSQ